MWIACAGKSRSNALPTRGVEDETLAVSLKDRFANWSRFQTIVGVLAKHGFSSVLHELGLGGPKAHQTKSEADETTIPARLRMACEELGPTFIKLGQLLSTRPDILPDAYVHEFSKLTDQVPGFPFSQVKEILKNELGEEPEVLFSFLDPQPLAAASIAQVHKAIVRESGDRIVLKIQRPGINKTIQTDIQILYRLASALEKVREDFRLMNLTAIVREFQRSINEELDFTLEAKNLETFLKNLGERDGITFPQPIWTFTTKKVLAMTQMEGTPLSQVSELPSSVDRAYLVESICTFFFESMFFHGLFHADAHAGNILLQPEGKGRLVLLDFGMVGTLNADLRGRLSKIFLALISQDFETLSQTYIEIGEFGRRFNSRDFQQDVASFLRPRLGRPLKEIHLGELMLESTRIARKYQVRVPRDLILFYRSIITLEAIGRRLDPDFEFITYGQNFARDLMKRRFSSDELMKDFLKTLEGLRSLGTEVPSQVRSILHRMEQDDAGLGFASVENQREHRHLSRIALLGFLSLNFLGLIFLSNQFEVLRNLAPSLWIAWGISMLIGLIVVVRH